MSISTFLLAYVLVHVHNISGRRNKKPIMVAASGIGAPGWEGDFCFTVYLLRLFDVFTMYMNDFFN